MNSRALSKRSLSLFFLALGGFAIGCSEFGVMGLLPEMSKDLLPTTYAANREEAIGLGGWLATAYALGVVVCAPVIGALAGRFSRRRMLIILSAALSAGTMLTAVLPGFIPVVATRALSALPHGTYFGVAALAASAAFGINSRAKGVAWVLGGLSLSNVIGSPLVTAVGQLFHWRISYAAISALFLIACIGLVATLPVDRVLARAAGTPHLFRQVSSSSLWSAMTVGALACGAMFAIITYAAPITLDFAMLQASFVPLAMGLIGLGMTVANYVGGWLGDRRLDQAYLFSYGLGALAVAVLLIAGHNVVGLSVGLVFVGASAGAIAPCVQVSLMNALPHDATLAASLNSACLNMGNGLGALLGGITVSLGLGYQSPILVAVAMISVALLVSLANGALRSLPSPLAKGTLT